ncbi:DUF3465 domain-containing protein [Marinicella sp. W31]|uniref:DUF3465 domain-containing protein n=1 Tax=Marinicella sp. W31 TaxID=3023713 RepID=UPI0037576434
MTPGRPNIKNKKINVVSLVSVLLIVVFYYFQTFEEPGSETTLQQLYAQRISDEMVSFSGTVEKILSDDLQGSKHQRLIIRTGQQTVLLAHNIDLAERVPVEAGDRLAVYGEYEWNDKGGVVHWTHKDPRNRHPHGWIKHKGKVYQ